MAEGNKAVDLTSLSLEQLSEVIKQLDSELEYLSTSYGQLGRAQLKFRECLANVNDAVRAENDGIDKLKFFFAYVSLTIVNRKGGFGTFDFKLVCSWKAEFRKQ